MENNFSFFEELKVTEMNYSYLLSLLHKSIIVFADVCIDGYYQKINIASKVVAVGFNQSNGSFYVQLIASYKGDSITLGFKKMEVGWCIANLPTKACNVFLVPSSIFSWLRSFFKKFSKH